MKEKELRRVAHCGLCGRPFGTSGIFFYRVTIERFGVDVRAVAAQDGLAAMLGGNSYLANAMGADEDLAIRVMEPATVTVCEKCSTTDICVASLAETAAEPLVAVDRAAPGENEAPSDTTPGN